MKSTVTTISPAQKDLDFELEAEEVGPAYEKIIDGYARRVKVPGFRAGHAPRDMIKRLFPDELRSALIDEIAPRALADSMKTHGLNPVTVPVIHDIEFEEQKPLRFKAAIEVWPEFDLPEYRKVKVTKVEAKVEDKEIDEALEQLRQKSAEFVPVADRGVADGDYVVVEWKGRDLASKRLLPTEKAVVLAGHQENEKILNENLLEARPGEEREFQIDHPADHANKKIAGKSILYKMKVQSIKAKKLPEINDDLAKSVGEGDTLPELRERLRQEILRSREKAARNAMAEEILKTLSEGLKIELPDGLLEREAESLIRRRFGVPAEDVERSLAPEALTELRTQVRVQARQSLLNHLLLSRVAQKENLSVSEEELTEELKSLAQANRVPLARLRENLEKDDRLDEVRETLVLRKTIDFLVNDAIIK
jgi:trigger factor